MSDDPSATISRAFEIVAKTGAEWRLFMESLEEELRHVRDYQVGEPEEDWNNDPEDWTCTSMSYGFPVKQQVGSRGQPRRIGNLCLILDLHHADYPSAALGRALLQVGWAPKGGGWNAGDLTLPALGEDYQLHGERLFLYTGEDAPSGASVWRDMFWLYLLPLGAVRVRTDVSRMIIDPVFDLVRGKPEAEAFARTPEVMRFTETEGSIHRVDALPSGSQGP